MARVLGSKNKNKKQFCKYGHDTFICGRNGSGMCNICFDLAVKKSKKKHKNKIKKYNSKYHGKHKNKLREKARKHYWINRDKILKQRRKKAKELRKYEKKWRKKNVRKYKNYLQKYKQSHLKEHRIDSLKCSTNRALRVPNFGQDEIKDFYKNCPDNKVVDHIIPLQGKLVSGLHVSWNLQYLTIKQNSKKANNVDLMDISRKYGNTLEKFKLK